MDIKHIMTDGKIDGGKMYSYYGSSRRGGSEDFNAFAEAINAYIATLNQSTPITPELLKRAGWATDSVLGDDEYRKNKFAVINGDDRLVTYESHILRIVVCFPYIKTMEELSELHRFYTGQPLNWQHDPAAELRKRLEVMGFKSNAGNNYRLSLGFPSVWLFVELDNNLDLVVGIGQPRMTVLNIKTIDQLEKLVGVLKGE